MIFVAEIDTLKGRNRHIFLVAVERNISKSSTVFMKVRHTNLLPFLRYSSAKIGWLRFSTPKICLFFPFSVSLLCDNKTVMSYDILCGNRSHSKGKFCGLKVRSKKYLNLNYRVLSYAKSLNDTTLHKIRRKLTKRNGKWPICSIPVKWWNQQIYDGSSELSI